MNKAVVCEPETNYFKTFFLQLGEEINKKKSRQPKQPQKQKMIKNATSCYKHNPCKPFQQASLALAEEDWGIHLQALCPLWTDTQLIRQAGMDRKEDTVVSPATPEEGCKNYVSNQVQKNGVMRYTLNYILITFNTPDVWVYFTVQSSIHFRKLTFEEIHKDRKNY